MTLAFDTDDPDYRALAQMVETEFGSVPDLAIASGDEMYAYSADTISSRTLSLMAYFRAGMQINDVIRQVSGWHFGAGNDLKSFLDFASGYGRSTRFLQADVGAARVWASEILPDAMEFQRQHFGVHTIASATAPENFDPGKQFDCIFVSSLFSHLPERTFISWLSRLFSLVSPGGILIFSVHGESAYPTPGDMPTSGLHFTPLSEIPSLDLKDYGSAIVTDEFVRTAIQGATGKMGHARIERGLCFKQDIYVVAKGELKSGPIPFQYGPNGCVDVCRWIGPDKMRLSGWAFDLTAGELISVVEIYYNGVLRGTARPRHLRPDIANFHGCLKRWEAIRSGWECMMNFTGEEIRLDQDWLLVRATSSAGKRFVLCLEHPANLDGFQRMRMGYGYSEDGSGEVRTVLGYVEHPASGMLNGPYPMISGWLAAKDESELAGLRLAGCFGLLPFSVGERLDVAAAYPDLCAVGFHIELAPEYLNVRDPRLEFISRSGKVLVTLGCLS